MVAGDWPPGSRLPPEVELAAELGVSRSTLREALGSLEREGLVLRRQRAGTTVRARPSVRHQLQRNHSVAELIESSGRRHAVSQAKIGFVAASPEIAAALELDAGARIVVLERTRTADGEPVVHTIDALDSRIVEHASAPLLPDISFYRWLQVHCSISVSYGVARVAAMLPAPEVASELRIAVTTPVLTLTQVDFATNGHPVLHSREYHRDDAFEVTVIRSGPFDS